MLRARLAVPVLVLSAVVGMIAVSPSRTVSGVVRVTGVEECSGFYINATTVATAGHCVADRAQVFRPESGTYCEAVTAQRFSTDMALLKACRFLAPTTVNLSGAIRSGATIWTTGYSFKSPNQAVTKQCTVRPRDQPPDYLILDCEVLAGQSGSPVVDGTGQLIGLIVTRCPESNCGGAAIQIPSLLDQAKVIAESVQTVALPFAVR